METADIGALKDDQISTSLIHLAKKRHYYTRNNMNNTSDTIPDNNNKN